MHKRAAIRAAIAAALIATPELATRVDTSRVRRTQDPELPVALVYSLQEPNQRGPLNGPLLRRLSVIVEIRVKALATLDDDVDTLCAVVEAALAIDPSFGRLAMDSYLESTQIGLSGEGEVRHGVAILTYAVSYVATPGP